MNKLSKGLYAITDSHLIGERLIESVEAAILGGATVVQYRDKSADHVRRAEEASALQLLCRVHNVIFIINDDVELAAQIGADGLHIGQEDDSLNQARQRLGRVQLSASPVTTDLNSLRLRSRVVPITSPLAASFLQTLNPMRWVLILSYCNGPE